MRALISPKTIIFLSFVVLLTACDKPPTELEKSPIPIVSDWMALSKNEFEEIERRCIGVSHPTCTVLPQHRESREKYEKLKKQLGW